VISIDPSRKRTGGALLGDRIRMNAIGHPNIYMRSLATRDTGSEISKALPDVIDRKSTRLNSSHNPASRMPSSA
jgi:methylmalonyl-CoA mutase